MRSSNVTNPNGRKKIGTKFSQYQKKKMLEFAERVGWKLQKQDEELISDFCSKIGIKKRLLKEWMIASFTIDILPECLIHKIVSYLSFKEATKMSILSKTWLQASLTHPNLEFNIGYLKDNMKIVDSIMERYRDGKIPIEKFKLFSRDSYYFPLLIDKWLDIAFQNGVKDLVFGVPTLNRCLILRVSLSSCVVNCRSLRNLSLFYINIDKNMLQTLLNCCPLIVAFSLEYCSGLKKIELLSLQKIKSISIRILEYQRVKIQAPTLEHMLYSGYSLEELDIIESQNLKSLVLSWVRISNGSLQHLFSRSQVLESLTLLHIYEGLERLNIWGSQSLKVMKIQDCDVEAIDAPNLVSLDYEGNVPDLKIAKASSQLKHSKIRLHCYDKLNAAWFCKLKEFLSNATSWSNVSLYFHKCNEIKKKDLQLYDRVAIPQVDILNVDIMWMFGKCPTLVDGLLWSCRPTRLNLKSTSDMIICFIDRLMRMKNYKPFHSQLREVKVYTVDGKRELELSSGKLAVTTLAKNEKVYILLDW